MKKVLILLPLLICLLCACGEGYSPPKEKENPHLYWADKEMEIIEITKLRSLNGIRREVHCTLYSEEYNCTFEYSDISIGMSSRPRGWDYKEGDIVEVEVYTWKYNSTGEISKRIVHFLY